MSRLQSLFEDRVDFVHIDWDDGDSLIVLQYFGILRRSSYLLLDPHGGILWQWVGPLQEQTARQQIEQALESSK